MASSAAFARSLKSDATKGIALEVPSAFKPSFGQQPGSYPSPRLTLPAIVPKEFFGLHILDTVGSIEHPVVKVTQWPAPATPAGPGPIFSHMPAQVQWPDVPFGAWRLWDAFAPRIDPAAAIMWPQIEPKKNEFHFELLDAYVNLARMKGVEVVIPLAMTPLWAIVNDDGYHPYYNASRLPPDDFQDWYDFVFAVATRYKRLVRYYELWNEPNLPDGDNGTAKVADAKFYGQFFSGTYHDMAMLALNAHKALKNVDPVNQLIGPPCTGTVDSGDPGSAKRGFEWLDQYWMTQVQDGHETHVASEFTDIVSYHFYTAPDRPELAVTTRFDRVPPSSIDALKSVMRNHGLDGKPLWVTEGGWKKGRLPFIIDGTPQLPLPCPVADDHIPETPDSDVADFVLRAYGMYLLNGCDRFFYYAWNKFNNCYSLLEPRGTWSTAVRTYQTAFRWLCGARASDGRDESPWKDLRAMNPTRDGDLFVIRLERPDEPLAWMAWIAQGAPLPVPGVRSFRDRTDDAVNVNGDSTVTTSPRLFSLE